MTWIADVTSEAAGAQVRLFEFIGPATTWRYTSGPVALTYSGNTYTPAPGLDHGALPSSSFGGAATLTVSCRYDLAPVVAYGFGSPPRSLRLRVLEYQETSAAAQQVWEGIVTGIAPKGAGVTIQSESLVARQMGTQIPGLVVQPRCQHFLYDARCRVARASFDQAATVSVISESTITVSTVGGHPDGYYDAGEVVRDADGERRAIVRQLGAVLELLAPFSTLATSDAVTLYAGCDHTPETCRDKFANVANFSGLPTVPASNPFTVDVRRLG